MTVAIVPSRTDPGKSYRVDIAIDGAPICSCPGFTNRGDCWHARLVREERNLMSESSTALVPLQLTPSAAVLPSEHELALIDRAAAMAYAGAIALPKELNTKEKVAAVMLYGFELGLKPMSAIRHIYIVEGRPQPSAEVMAGLLLASEPDARLSVVALTELTCTMRIVRPSKNINETYTVTMDDATKAGLSKRDGWMRYPKDRLRWHCTKRILRIYAPDAINAIEALEHPVPAAEYRELRDDELYNEGDDSRHGAAPQEPEPINGDAQQTGSASGQDLLAQPAAPPVKTEPLPTPEELELRAQQPAVKELNDWWATVLGEKFNRIVVVARSKFGYDGREPAELTAEERTALLADLRKR